MRIDIVSLFPAMFDGPFAHGVVGRAKERGLLETTIVDPRAFATTKHHSVDDYPYGGGPGMVLMPDPMFRAVEALALPQETPVILMTPQGRPLSQAIAGELALRPRVVMLCGHYEGVDERIGEYLANDAISIGDYVLGGGELPAMVITDAVARLLPGAMDAESGTEESHTAGLLEYPHYTRPARYREWDVPAILLSGNHAAIAAWRREQSLRRTLQRRPDLIDRAALTPRERETLERWRQEEEQPPAADHRA